MRRGGGRRAPPITPLLLLLLLLRASPRDDGRDAGAPPTHSSRRVISPPFGFFFLVFFCLVFKWSSLESFFSPHTNTQRTHGLPFPNARAVDCLWRAASTRACCVCLYAALLLPKTTSVVCLGFECEFSSSFFFALYFFFGTFCARSPAS